MSFWLHTGPEKLRNAPIPNCPNRVRIARARASTVLLAERPRLSMPHITERISRRRS